ncbi:alkylmercury lyase family protein [Streptomyces sp. NPDC090442]|uniref:alkylmercury lyase family protein n=1 Tax=Streptomyces sp. NPDC090442 TaxID=3365962 RepID=UPI003811D258
MRITVLTVPECPNGPVAHERIQRALAGRRVEVTSVTVSDEREAARWGMTGSPTVLLDGIDPFAPSAAPPSVSCRLYHHGDGTTDGAPNVTELRRALSAFELDGPDGPGGPVGPDALGGLKGLAGTEERGEEQGPADADDDACCESDALDLVGRGGRGRLAPEERGLRAVQQAVLRHFATTGRAPDTARLEAATGGAADTALRPVNEVLAELAREDFLTLDENGRIAAAYPFSATPTRHRVVIDGGTRGTQGIHAWAMCAIDALGIPAMLGKDVVVHSSDPVTGEPITVTLAATDTATGTNQDSHAIWEPSTAVVFVGRRSYSGPAAAVCCDALNFFASGATARAWKADHPDVHGRLVDQSQAEHIGRRVFGPLLSNVPRYDGN